MILSRSLSPLRLRSWEGRCDPNQQKMTPTYFFVDRV